MLIAGVVVILVLALGGDRTKDDGAIKGLGTRESPYVIATAKQLKVFAESVNGGNACTDVYYALGGNIDLGGADWTPVGVSEEKHFVGNFDGRGNTVGNFKMENSLLSIGLFGFNGGTIQDLGVINFTIYGTLYLPVDYAGGLVGYNSGNVKNSYATADLAAPEDRTLGTYYCCIYSGGLVGYNAGTITGCLAVGNAFAASFTVDSPDSAYAGGLVGYNAGNINDSFATGGAVAWSGISDASAYSGGLAGYNCGAITSSYATGESTADNTGRAYSGGLIGWNDGTVTGCYASGDASANAGLGAVLAGISVAHAGGLIGHNSAKGDVSSCFATGDTAVITDAFRPYDFMEAVAGEIIGYNVIAAIGPLYRSLYRYKGQMIYIEKASVITIVVDSGNWGVVCTAGDFNSVAFYIDTLGWDTGVWNFDGLNFEQGSLPRLRTAASADAIENRRSLI